MNASLTPRRERALLLALAGIQFTNIVDFMVMMPLGPRLTQLFAISDAQFGLLVSAYTFASGASGLIGAAFIDRLDRRRALLTAYALFALATLGCGLAQNYEQLMAARVAAGIFGGSLSALTQTLVAETIPFERRGRAMGVVMTSFSLAAVAGVPLSLLLATHLSWHAPFFAVALASVVLGVAAWAVVPGWRAPSANAQGHPGRVYLRVLADGNHRRAFLFSALVMFSGFTIIPFLTLYAQTNVGLTDSEVPVLYLCGGLATLFTSRWIGRLADHWGKLRVFRWVALLGTVPMLVVTSLPPSPAWLAIGASTLLFVAMNGRMVPGMALVGAVADARLRGAFLSMNGSLQSAAMGVAALVSGAIIGRDAQGLIVRYWLAALVGIGAIALAAWLAGKLVVRDAVGGPTGRQADS